MIKSYKNRTLNKEKKVKIYRNLHNGLLSVKQDNVKGHTDLIYLKNVTFKVLEKGHAKVLLTKQKNVHAYVVGSIVEEKEKGEFVELFYDPYIAGYFRDKDNNKIEQAKFIQIDSNGKMFAIL